MLTIVILTSQRPRPGSTTTDAVGLLRRWGVGVQVTQPALAPDPVDPTADLHLLRSIDDSVLEAAGIVEAAGGRCLNSVATVRLTRNRERLAATLGAVGVPLCDGDATAQPGQVAKVYRIGRQVFGVFRQPGRPATPFTVPASVHALSALVTDALGTSLFGLDVQLTGDHPSVLDVHPFPGFKGVPDAGLRLADYILAAANTQVVPR